MNKDAKHELYQCHVRGPKVPLGATLSGSARASAVFCHTVFPHQLTFIAVLLDSNAKNMIKNAIAIPQSSAPANK